MARSRIRLIAPSIPAPRPTDPGHRHLIIAGHDFQHAEPDTRDDQVLLLVVHVLPDPAPLRVAAPATPKP